MTAPDSTDRAPAVLLVDDVDANLVALEGVLGNLPCQLVRASSGNEALRQLLKREFAVMLLDVQMPEMDGYEVARHVRSNPTTRDVPIIFVTAMHDTREAVLRGYDSGAIDLLFKPVDPDVLRSKIRVFLDLYLSQRRLRDEIAAHKRTLGELEAFNYSVSHDLRAPLRPLSGFSQVLIDDYGDKLDDTARNYLRRIQAAANRMGQLIDDLLQLSRLTGLEARRQPVDLGGLITAVVSELRVADPTRDVELVCATDARTDGDPRLLRIAFENLLRNAWKFTHKKPHARIEFGKQPGGETVYFIHDDGVGFDQAHAHKLFQPFQRLHGAGDFEGTGIGLAIVDRIIKRHDGRIWAEGVPGTGATFYFTLAPPPPAGLR